MKRLKQSYSDIMLLDLEFRDYLFSEELKDMENEKPKNDLM